MKRRGMAGPAVIVLLGAALAFAGACQTKAPDERNAPVLSAADSTARAMRVERGQKAFLANCAMCHGVWGEGDGPRYAEVLKRGGKSPAFLNDAALLDTLSREQMIRIITMGGSATHLSKEMPPWGQKLPVETIHDIADFVKSLPSLKPGIPKSTIENYLAAAPGQPTNGRKLFVFYCTVCHGPNGKGDGMMSDTLWTRFKVRPRNLTDSTYIATKTDRELFVTISLGGGYTGHSGHMPAWSANLKPEQVKDLVSYVRELSRTEARP
jgi:cbb3-type cytochrome c oxidase subunit III